MNVKAKSRRRLLILLAGLFLLAALVGGFYGYRKYRIRRELASFRTEGMAAARAGEQAKAVRYLRPYLYSHPEDAEALAAYAASRREFRDPAEPRSQALRETIAVLRNLVKLEPDRLGDWRALLQLYGQTPLVTETLDAAGGLLEAANRRLAKDPADAEALAGRREALAQKTYALMRLRQYSEVDGARAAARAWRQAAPGDVRAHVALLSVMQQAGEPADRILREARRAGEPAAADDAAAAAGRNGAGGPATQPAAPAFAPGDPRLLAVQAAAAGLVSKADEARRLWREAAARPLPEPPDPAYAKLLYLQLDAAELHKESLKLLTDLAGRAGAGWPWVRHALVQRLWEAGDAARYVELFPEGPSAAPASQPSAGAPAVAAVGPDALAPADAGDDDTTVLAMQAGLLKRAGRADAAASTSAQLAARADDPVAQAWRAVLDQPNPPPAPLDAKGFLARCTKALELRPKDPYLRYFAGEAYAQLGEMELALESWRQAAANSNTWSAPLVRTAAVLAAKGRLEPAGRAIDAALARAPESFDAWMGKAQIWAALSERQQQQAGVPKELMDLVRALRAAAPGDERGMLLEVSLLARDGRRDAARQAAAKVLESPALRPATLLGLAELSAANDLGVADACFARFRREQGERPELAFAEAVQDLRASRRDQGFARLDQGRRAAGGRDEPAWSLAAARYLDLAADPRAKDEWVALADRYPADARVQEMALASPATQADRKFRDTVAGRLRDLTGDQGPTWRLARARLLLEERPADPAKLDEAAKLLTEVLRLTPASSEARLLMAACAEAKGDVDGAITHLTAVVNREPEAAEAGMRLVRLLNARGRFTEAREQLDRVARGRLEGAAARRQAAVLFATLGDSRRAIELLAPTEVAGDAARAGGQSDADKLLLASLYRAHGQPDKAEPLLRELLQQPTPSVEAIMLAAGLYQSQGRTDEAGRALALLDRVTLEPGVRQLLLADHYSRFGDLGKALELATEATRASPANSATWAGLVLLRLGGGQGAEAVAAAEQALGALSAAAPASAPAAPAGGTADGATASADARVLPFRLVVRNKDVFVPAAADPALRPLAVFTVQNPAAADSGPALEALRAVVEGDRGREPLDRTVRRLRPLADRNPKCVPLQNLLALYYVGPLDRPDEAVAVAQRARQASPGAPEPAALAFEAYRRLGRWAEALDAATAWRDRLPARQAPADLAVAQAYLGLKKPADAMAQLQPHLRRALAEPDSASGAAVVTQYAAAAVAAGRGAEADKLLWESVPQAGGLRLARVVAAAEQVDAPTATRWLRRLQSEVAASPGAAPGDLAARLALAQAWSRLAERTSNNDCAAAARALLEAAEPTPDVLGFLGVLHEADGDKAGAEALYRRSVAADRPPAVAQNNLAMLLAARPQDVPEAVKLASAAVQANPRVATFYDTLAQAQAKARLYDASVQNLNTAVWLEPGNLTWRLHLLQVLADQGRREEAARVLADLEGFGSVKIDRSLTPAEQAQLRGLRQAVSAEARSG